MSDKQPIPYRPFGIIKTHLENLGFEVTHYYEDLIFTEHNAFLLRMEEKGEDVSLLFNIESDKEKHEEIATLLQTEGNTTGLNITPTGTYTMTANDEDATIDITFHED